MDNYKSGIHTVWDCKYHLVWVTKYRYPVLGGDIGQRCRELLREIACSKEMQRHAGSINRDHVHMLLRVPPNLSISRAVQYLKGKSSHRLLIEFTLPGKHLELRNSWGRQGTGPRFVARLALAPGHVFRACVRPLVHVENLAAVRHLGCHRLATGGPTRFNQGRTGVECLDS